jgi:hypothetical protein
MKAAVTMVVQVTRVQTRGHRAVFGAKTRRCSSRTLPAGCEKHAHSNGLVLLVCDSVASRNMVKSVGFQYGCKRMSASEPIWSLNLFSDNLALYADAPGPHTAGARTVVASIAGARTASMTRDT